MIHAPTVFIVDDDVGVRKALQFLLIEAGLRAEVYSSAKDFLDRYAPGRPGCAVLDIRMPGMSGLDLQRELQARHISLPVIFLTGHGDVPVAVRAFKGGAFDFLEKPFDNGVLLQRVRNALARDATTRPMESKRREVIRRIALLKPEERDVLDGIIAGDSNKVMAANLCVTTSTIEKRRKQIMEKLEADNLSHLLRMVLCFGVQDGRHPLPGSSYSANVLDRQGS